MITPAQRAEIRRLYYGEHWKLGTIAAQLGLHRETVRAAVEHESGAGRPGVYRPSALDPYLPFIRDTLAQYPRLRATRIHEMVRQRGYPGSVNQLRRIVKRLRPETGRTVYRRVVTLTGESAQVDWGSFGKVRIGHGTRAVSGFVMVLGYSRAIAALFTLDQTLESFLRGHVKAFDALGGTARTLVYDNLRSAVLDRRGAAVQFHPRSKTTGQIRGSSTGIWTGSSKPSGAASRRAGRGADPQRTLGDMSSSSDARYLLEGQAPTEQTRQPLLNFEIASPAFFHAPTDDLDAERPRSLRKTVPGTSGPHLERIRGKAGVAR